MKTLRQLCFSMVLVTALVAPALAGDTQTPPGETHTPPAAQGISETPPGQTNTPPVAPGETSSPPAPGETHSPPATALLMYLIQTWLSVV